MKKYKSFFIAMSLLFSTAVQAQPPIMLSHNGSLMQVNLDQRTGAFNIVYAQPKPSLLAIGVMPGTLLIAGQLSPAGPLAPFRAVAHVYDRFCGAVPYPVMGRWEGNTLILEGPAPIVWAGTCIIAEYYWSHNSYLRFDVLRF